MSFEPILERHGIQVVPSRMLRNATPAVLYEQSILQQDGAITADGALAATSGEKTGRSPKDKRIVRHADSAEDIWWGPINIPLEERSFMAVRQRAIDFLEVSDALYVVDGYAGWDPDHQLKVRVICARPYHALFMRNMLIRPIHEELAHFGKPDYVIYNAGHFPASPYTPGVESSTCVALSFERGEMVILGTEYAGEMKKGIFTVMNYLMPKQGILSMHCSANEGDGGDVSLFFGLSGTGKTTLSSDPHRRLIGDDEHCWSDAGIFNIEGGCYAKCLNLSEESEPLIYHAIRFGAVLENVVYDPHLRVVDYSNASITQNTRASYPIEYIPHAKIPCVGDHPSNIFLLTCDAFGVLPPVARLTPEQTMYHFISGYTAKVAGTEMGIREPTADFSACFGAPFLVWHPMKYAEMLAERMKQHKARAWLINTGWIGGGYGVGKRIDLKFTRAMIDAIHEGKLNNAKYDKEPVFGLQIPKSVPGVPARVLTPWTTWASAEAYARSARDLAQRFLQNFTKYQDLATPEVLQAGPNPEAASVLTELNED
ncbi:MAG: phosphoenolpyruvate carboxykinase [ATP] 2 [Pirellulaceae bacterium]|nr:MAG: phosphoenolpyruvate carboxykinase [ATP] 2 [Pirellulaceae bacterium]